ncbi:FADH(2)-oxidizing methylenetetrahydrofolate--tRNA-(uracil(54)-C(5))-methyltransferase TrmFO [Desulfothermobacter acidiphilus]|uniref:FADH(2)-oxidizing methylenetetrahydrofolate--tRNA-(uracil(54)-C(5))- methyltransferase TrmFO n=1 Tax=Desulfothermobacter acidiphilus TaxID=1938353 RepID=UPI003F8CEE69
MRVVVVGAGLAGAEAAWQIARRGVRVKLYEMRPYRMTPAHRSGYAGELVCSNSLRAEGRENAVGLLKEEMRLLGSLIMEAADAHRVPAGGSLAVDRERFAAHITAKLEAHPLIDLERTEVTALPDHSPTIIATGPLTSPSLSAAIRELTGEDYLYFYDAVAPIVTLESINQERVFWSSRYNKGEPAYINCPMTQEEYERFFQELVAAERIPLKEFEQEIHFEGCMPIEVMAARGKETLLYGPLKPVGLIDPRTGQRPYAVVQLRQDNREGTLFNMVGFQTNLKWGEQNRVFRLIPGLEQAEFVRYGMMHRNTFLNAPLLLQPTLLCSRRPGLFFAGQITGVEGYVESAAAGLVAGINAARLVRGEELLVFPPVTAHGALLHYITTADPRYFQPMNINYGLFPPLEERVRDKRQRRLLLAARALAVLRDFIRECHLEG